MPQSQTALLLPRRDRVLARLVSAVRAAALRRRERRQLAALDAHLLRDIGLDSQTAANEATKPFWKA